MPIPIQRKHAALVHSRGGFSLPEALIAMTLVAMAASALLLSSYSSLGQMTDSVDATVAQGIAAQLMDEIAAHPMRRVNDAAAATIPTVRAGFTFIDNYDNYVASPVDAWGIPLGQGDGAGGQRHPNLCVPANVLSSWLVKCQVTAVAADDLEQDLASDTDSPCRRVEIWVVRPESGREIPLAYLRRVLVEVSP